MGAPKFGVIRDLSESLKDLVNFIKRGTWWETLTGRLRVTVEASSTVSVQGANADGSGTLAQAVMAGGKDTGALTRYLSLSDGGGVVGPAEVVSIVTAFSAGSGTPAEGTNCKTIASISGRDAEIYFGCYAQGNSANTMQILGSNDLITWSVIPMTRIDGIVTTAMYAQLATWVPTTNASYRGKSYGYAWIRVQQTARTTTGTSGIIRIVPTSDVAGNGLSSAFTLDQVSVITATVNTTLIAANAVTTTATHNLVVGQPVIFPNVSGITGLTAYVMYWIQAVTSTTLTFAATLGGTVLTITGTPGVQIPLIVYPLESAGTANGALQAGGARTLYISAKGSNKAILTIDALTYGTAAPTSSAIVLEGYDGATAAWYALTMQQLGGGPARLQSITGAYGTTTMPVGGTWEADVSQYSAVRVRWSALTVGTSVGPRYHGGLKVVSAATTSRITAEGNLTVQLGGSNVGPFNDVVTAELTPVVQLSFMYGLLTSMGAGTTLNSATVDTNLSRLRLQSGTNSAGSAIYTSREPARYRTGQGIIARFTCAFDGATASNTQFVGVNTTEDAYGFGFNGTSFGIRYKYFTTDTWIPQGSWNGDHCDGSGGDSNKSGFNWNKTLGNVMMVKYPFLGYGPITFWVLHPTGYWILCHTIQFPNTLATTQIQNPNMFFVASNINSGSTTARIMYVGSVGIFSVGQTAFPCAPQWGIDSTKATITTETNLVTIKVCTSLNGIANRGMIRLRNISFANTVSALNAAGIATYRLKLGTTLGGSPSYTPIAGTATDAGVALTLTSANSMVSYDVAGTTITNGTYKFSQVVSQNGNNSFDLTPFNIYVMPGEILTISAAAGTSATCAVAINWDEEV